jgi:hypothetical protein
MAQLQMFVDELRGAFLWLPPRLSQRATNLMLIQDVTLRTHISKSSSSALMR